MNIAKFFDIKSSLTRKEYLITLAGCLLLCVIAELINTYVGMAVGVLASIWLVIAGFRRYNGFEKGMGLWSVLIMIIIISSLLLSLAFIPYGVSKGGNPLFAVPGFIAAAVLVIACGINVYVVVKERKEEV